MMKYTKIKIKIEIEIKIKEIEKKKNLNQWYIGIPTTNQNEKVPSKIILKNTTLIHFFFKKKREIDEGLQL